ncbi:unnamed protein product [Spirodela intermedia]|uniref:Uncharacterized protein n=1 Tax=Spirodela intermedia TaxID=51605 RepID=A0A7I8KH93_SPIIN|nr:unnamed protein product [Spirodela intermedia]
MGFVAGGLPGFLLVLVVFSGSFLEGEATVWGYPTPSNCRTLECPSYEVIYSQKDFEIRRYPKAVWVSTPPLTSRTYREAADRGFNFLFAYINGRNDRGVRVDMTAPALVDITPAKRPSSNSTFVVRFFVPRKFQKSPPTAPLVIAGKWPGPRYAAVRRFGGFANDNNIPPQALALAESLRGTRWAAALGGRGGVPSTYTVGSYNGPFEFDRVNEVFFLF